MSLLGRRANPPRRDGAADAGRFRGLMESAHVGIWRVDTQGATLELNRRMADLLGVEPGEMTGRGYLEFVPPEWTARAGEAWAVALTGRAEPSELCLRTRDGSRRHVTVSHFVERDASGAPCGLLGVFVDVTDHLHADEEAREAISLLEASLESTADGLLIVDRQGRIVRFNERFVRMWRIPADVIESRDDDRALQFVLSQLAEPEAFLAKVKQLYATPERDSFDTFRFKDGRIFERYSIPQRVRGDVVGRVWSFRDVTDRERAEQARREATEREATIARNLDAALFTFVIGADGRISHYEYFSEGAEALFGLPLEEMLGDPEYWYRRVHPDDLRHVITPAHERLLRLESVTSDFRYEASKGIWRWHRTRLTPRRGPDGTIVVDALETDVTDRIALEEQLRHAQKMEAVGQLAGGVAHDFNNILTAILGYADLLLRRLPAGDPSRASLTEIRKAGERATALTRQLLAFSRRGPSQPRVLDLGATLRDLAPMVARVVGESVTLDLDFHDGPTPVRIDRSQLEQVIVNLVVNARDAMPAGGTISLRTGIVTLAPGSSHPASETLQPGRYVRLEVEDTGAGIPPDVLPRVFEPFFTTKGPGQGTGLGLATVYGIVEQNHGRIRVASVVDQGTAFEIMLPAVEGEPADLPVGPAEGRGGTETVLLVEDDADLLLLARLMLEGLGYRVLAAPGGAEALRLASEPPAPIHLLLTDVVMPGMGGQELAARVLAARPGIRVLFMSGYTPDVSLRESVRDARVPFLAKPFTVQELARALREALDGPPANLPTPDRVTAREPGE